MAKYRKIQSKLLLLFFFIYLVSVVSLILINSLFTLNSQKKLITTREIPDTAELILNDIYQSVIGPADALELVSNNPLIKEWILLDEPEDDLDLVLETLQGVVDKYGTMGSNITSALSGNYRSLINGEYSIRQIGEDDGWFPAFGRSGNQFAIAPYTDHKLLGEVAFINSRIDQDGEYLGIVSMSLDLSAIIKSVVSSTVGEEGVTYLCNSDGLITVHIDKEKINKAEIQEHPAIRNSWSAIKSSQEYLMTVDRAEGRYFLYSRYIPELDWYLITEASQKELFADIWRAIRATSLSAFLFFIVGAVSFFFMIRRIVNPISAIKNVILEISEGELAGRRMIDSNDEMGELSRAAALMSEKLSDIVRQVTDGSDSVLTGSREMNQSAEQLSLDASQQASSVEEISASVEQITANIENNAHSANETEKIARSAKSKAEESHSVMEETVSTLKDIGEKISIIEDIARQTNMLSLNASIEAARAGEAGKGFAVVAQEVRKLAELSKDAATQITQLSRNSGAVSERASVLMKELLPEIQRTSDLVESISAASDEQAAGMQQISKAVESLDQSIQRNAASSEELSGTSKQLNSEADALKGAISFFKLTDGQGAPGSSDKITDKTMLLEE